MNRKTTTAEKAALAGLILLGAALRLAFLLKTTVLEGDCAVMGLMTKRISEGKEFPEYLWLAHYSGSITAFVSALWFRLFGVSALAYQLTGFLCSCAYAWLVFRLAERVVGRPGSRFALALVLVPSYEMLSWTMWYQYGDTLTLACGVLLLLEPAGSHASPTRMAAMGLLSGLGLWTSPMFVPFLLTQAVVLLLRRTDVRDLAVWLTCFLIGYAPAIHYNLAHPGAQFQRMASRFLAIDREQWQGSASRGPLLAGALLRRMLRIPAIIARMPAQLAELTSWPDLALLVVSAIAAFRGCGRKVLAAGGQGIVLIYLGFFLVFHVLMVGQEDARFMFPLYLPFAVIAGGWLAELWDRRRPAAALALALVFAPHAYTLAQGLGHPEKPGIKALTAFLRAHGIAAAYSDYWTSYSTTFDAREEIMVSPTLYHPSRSDRTPDATARIRSVSDTAFVVSMTKQYCAAPELEKGLDRLGVTYKKTAVGEFLVYDGFSRRVLPEELSLAEFEHCAPR